GVKERFYGWAEITRMDMLATIADTCHELASRALRAGDVGAARTTAALGREIDPINEMAWRDAMQAELLAGDHGGFERVVALLQQQLDDFEDGYEPEPETQDLIDAGRNRARAMDAPRFEARDAQLVS
ncbi:MAG: bacterial transcriptional activator domain-containing protein, partial [Pseudoclavibacter sp.]